jgi:hypothetical protein
MNEIMFWFHKKKHVRTTFGIISGSMRDCGTDCGTGPLNGGWPGYGLGPFSGLLAADGGPDRLE